MCYGNLNTVLLFIYCSHVYHMSALKFYKKNSPFKYILFYFEIKEGIHACINTFLFFKYQYIDDHYCWISNLVRFTLVIKMTSREQKTPKNMMGKEETTKFNMMVLGLPKIQTSVKVKLLYRKYISIDMSINVVRSTVCPFKHRWPIQSGHYNFQPNYHIHQ